MLQIHGVFSRENRDGEPFAMGWWRRERYWKLTFSTHASVFQRAQAFWMRFSAHTGHNVASEGLPGPLMQINVQRTWGYIFDNKLGKFRTFYSVLHQTHRLNGELNNKFFGR
jgi:hypothetical protein